MAHPQIRNKALKLKLDLDHASKHNPSSLVPTAPSTAQRPAAGPMPDTPVSAQPSIFDFTFEDYKAAGFNIAEQHALIGKIREEVPLIDRDEIDGLILSEAAKQLELCVFPMCKMMHVDPRAVKRMLDREFRKAYGEDADVDVDVEIETELVALASAEGDITADRGPVVKKMEELFVLPFAREESSMFDESSRGGSMAPAGTEPAKKKAKRAPLSTIQKEIRAYQAAKKRGRRGCRIATLKSEAVVEKWASFESSKRS